MSKYFVILFFIFALIGLVHLAQKNCDTKLCDILPLGIHKNPDGTCGRIHCRAHGIQCDVCTEFQPTKGCIIKQDLSKNYPRCCPVRTCPKALRDAAAAEEAAAKAAAAKASTTKSTDTKASA